MTLRIGTWPEREARLCCNLSADGQRGQHAFRGSIFTPRQFRGRMPEAAVSRPNVYPTSWSRSESKPVSPQLQTGAHRSHDIKTNR